MHINGLTHRLKWALDAAAVPAYRITGRPYSPGYQTAKLRTITSAIDHGVVRDGQDLPAGYGIAMDERVVEYPWLFAHLKPDVGKMLDAGSALNHDYLLERPPLKGADLTIMTLAPEKHCYWLGDFLTCSGISGARCSPTRRLTRLPAFRPSSISASTTPCYTPATPSMPLRGTSG